MKFPAKKEVFTEASVLRKYNRTRQQHAGGKGKGKGGGQGLLGGKRLQARQIKAARTETTAQCVAQREAEEREAAGAHVMLLAGCMKAL